MVGKERTRAIPAKNNNSPMKAALLTIAVMMGSVIVFTDSADAYEADVRCFRDDLADGDHPTCDALGGFCMNRQCWCGQTAPEICSDTRRCDDRGYDFGQDPPGEESIDITECRGANSGAKGGVLSYCFPRAPVVVPPPTGTISGISSPRSTVLASDGSGSITGTVSGGSGSGYVVQTVIRRGDGTVCDDWTGTEWSSLCTVMNATVVGHTWALSGSSIPPENQMTSGQTYRVYALFTDSRGVSSPDWDFTPPILFQYINDARFISQSIPKTVLTTNEVMNVSVTMKNCRPLKGCSGMSTWTGLDTPAKFALGSQHPPDNATWGFGRVYFHAGTSVPPGSSYTVPMTIRAPATPGTYHFQWRMFLDGVGWFGEVTPDVAITVNTPVPPTASDVRASIRDYCTSATGADITWKFNGASSQSRFQVQVADGRGFATPAYDSGIIDGSDTAIFVAGTGSAGVAPGITWGTTYRARVKVWDVDGVPAVAYQAQSFCSGIGCVGGASWQTPSAAYPHVTMSYQPAQPVAEQTIQFTGGASCPGGGCVAWLWNFGDGSAESSTNPSHLYSVQGTYPVSLNVTDAQGNTCSAVTDVSVGKAVPFWKEALPW
jgi:PKD repeat protein